jgi:hypothetical protein
MAQGCPVPDSRPTKILAFGESYPSGGENKTCYRMYCFQHHEEPGYTWLELFDAAGCCFWMGYAIPLGDELYIEETACAVKTISCQPQPFSMCAAAPQAVVTHHNSMCCIHRGQTYAAGETVPIPEKCAQMVCTNTDAAGAAEGYSLQFQSVFDGSGCCMYMGKIVNEGWWVVDDQGRNVTCCTGHIVMGVDECEECNEPPLRELGLWLTALVMDLWVEIEANGAQGVAFLLDQTVDDAAHPTHYDIERQIAAWLALMLPVSETLRGFVNRYADTWAVYTGSYQCLDNPCDMNTLLAGLGGQHYKGTRSGAPAPDSAFTALRNIERAFRDTTLPKCPGGANTSKELIIIISNSRDDAFEHNLYSELGKMAAVDERTVITIGDSAATPTVLRMLAAMASMKSSNDSQRLSYNINFSNWHELMPRFLDCMVKCKCMGSPKKPEKSWIVVTYTDNDGSVSHETYTKDTLTYFEDHNITDMNEVIRLLK